MPSSYFGTRLGLISPLRDTGLLTLSITSGSTSLIQTGLSDVTVQDNLGNVVTGCTLVIADTSKCTASGQRLTGVGTTGNTTVYATRVGYNDSATVTITSTGSLLQNMVVGLGGNTTTDGQTLTSWIDQGSAAVTWAEAVFGPLYKTGGANGKPYLLFDGTTQFISSPSTAAYNVPGDDQFVTIMVQTTADTPGTDRTLYTSLIGTPTFQGARVMARSTNNVVRVQYGTGAATANIDAGTSSILAANVYYIGVGLRNNGALNQNLYINGTFINSITNTFRDNTTAVVNRIGVNQAGATEYSGMKFYGCSTVSRYPTATEIAQLFLRDKTYLGL